MQKLVFRNSKGIEIDLTSSQSGGDWGIIDWSGFSDVPVNIQSQQVPFQDGSVYLDALLEDRDIAITVAFNDEKDLEKRYRLKRELISVLNPKLGEGVLIYTNDFLSKQINCIPNIPLFANKNADEGGTNKVDVSFHCCNPYWEDITETEIRLKNGEIKTINNIGDIPVQVEVDVLHKVTSLLTVIDGFTIVNNTNGKKIQINGKVENDVSINTNIGKKSVVEAKGSKNIVETIYMSKPNFVKVLNGKIIVIDCEEEESYVIDKGRLSINDIGEISSSEGAKCRVIDNMLFIIDRNKIKFSGNGEDYNVVYTSDNNDICDFMKFDDKYYVLKEKEILQSSSLSNFTLYRNFPDDELESFVKSNNEIFIILNENLYKTNIDFNEFTLLVSELGHKNYGCIDVLDNYVVTSGNDTYISDDFGNTFTSIENGYKNINLQIYNDKLYICDCNSLDYFENGEIHTELNYYCGLIDFQDNGLKVIKFLDMNIYNYNGSIWEMQDLGINTINGYPETIITEGDKFYAITDERSVYCSDTDYSWVKISDNVGNYIGKSNNKHYFYTSNQIDYRVIEVKIYTTEDFLDFTLLSTFNVTEDRLDCIITNGQLFLIVYSRLGITKYKTTEDFLDFSQEQMFDYSIEATRITYNSKINKFIIPASNYNVDPSESGFIISENCESWEFKNEPEGLKEMGIWLITEDKDGYPVLVYSQDIVTTQEFENYNILQIETGVENWYNNFQYVRKFGYYLIFATDNVYQSLDLITFYKATNVINGTYYNNENRQIAISSNKIAKIGQEEKKEKNIIDKLSSDSDIGFNLETGVNNITANSLSGIFEVVIKFKNKYIGV